MATTPTTQDAVTMKVIGLGLPRTGTASMRDALTTLGFGPCYHMVVALRDGGKDFATWFKIGDGAGTAEDFYQLFRRFGSVVDAPTALYYEEMYAAYPDAKFILTTRDPAQWERSMRDTILRVAPILRKKPVQIGFEKYLGVWSDVYMEEKYHGGRLQTNAQQEILDHNERVKKLIPPEQLLVYEVGEGWDRLVDFLGMPQPDTPFPHINDTSDVQRWLKSLEAGDETQAEEDVNGGIFRV